MNKLKEINFIDFSKEVNGLSAYELILNPVFDKIDLIDSLQLMSHDLSPSNLKFITPRQPLFIISYSEEYYAREVQEYCGIKYCGHEEELSNFIQGKKYLLEIGDPHLNEMTVEGILINENKKTLVLKSSQRRYLLVDVTNNRAKFIKILKELS